MPQNQMELLIIKSGEQYIRHKDGVFTLCGLDRASVFPMDKLPVVRKHVAALHGKQFSQVGICKLTLMEEPFAAEEKCVDEWNEGPLAK